MFISIFAASCRPHNIVGFLDNLANTAADLQSFEVLIKLDEGDDTMISILEEYRKHAKFTLKYLATPKLDGYYTLDVGYNELLKIIDPNSYFCWLLTDEIRLETQGWDTILKKYIHLFPDDIFRIKLSIFQSKNYIDFSECLPSPDNYAVTTHKWLEVTGGWGNFWGPDSWHQCVDYYLGLCKNEFYPYGIWRSFPIFDIQVGGQEAGLGVGGRESVYKRMLRIFDGWRKHSTHAAQENFYRLAQRLNAHIYAHASQMNTYVIKENLRKKTVSICTQEASKAVATWKYKLPRLRLKIFIGYKRANLWQTFPFLYYWRRKLEFALGNFLTKMNATPASDVTKTQRLTFFLVYIPMRTCFRFLKKIQAKE